MFSSYHGATLIEHVHHIIIFRNDLVASRWVFPIIPIFHLSRKDLSDVGMSDVMYEKEQYFITSYILIRMRALEACGGENSFRTP